jgi:hypothetical protein
MELDILAEVGAVAQSTADTIIETGLGVIPIVVPVLALFWAVRYVLRKFNADGGAGLR